MNVAASVVRLFVELAARELEDVMRRALRRPPSTRAPHPMGRTYRETQAVEAQIRSATAFKVAGKR